MRDGGIDIANLKNAAVIEEVVKSTGIELGRIIDAGKAMKDIDDPDLVREVSSTISNFMSK